MSIVSHDNFSWIRFFCPPYPIIIKAGIVRFVGSWFRNIDNRWLKISWLTCPSFHSVAQPLLSEIIISSLYNELNYDIVDHLLNTQNRCSIAHLWRWYMGCLYELKLNSFTPGAAYMRQWIGSALVQIMACCPFGTKPLSKSMLGYCQ